MGVDTVKRPKTGERLFEELLRETKDQQKVDDPARLDRDRALTQEWRGTAVAVKVVGDGLSSLCIQGVEEETQDDTDSPTVGLIQFPYMSGVIRSVSAGNGGFIELQHGGVINLNHQGENGEIPADWQSGIEIEVVCEEPFEAPYTPAHHWV